MNRTHFYPGIICCLAFFLFALPVAADVLTIPNIDSSAGNAPDNVDRPSRGLTMEEVKAQFGEPKQVLPPVGDPPITRWIYEKFTVHFERNYVIDSVVHRK